MSPRGQGEEMEFYSQYGGKQFEGLRQRRPGFPTENEFGGKRVTGKD